VAERRSLRFPALKKETGTGIDESSTSSRFGPPNVITNDDLPQPEPRGGDLQARVKAEGVGHWDVSGFKLGDEVYGATTEQFSGAYAEYALPSTPQRVMSRAQTPAESLRWTP